MKKASKITNVICLCLILGYIIFLIVFWKDIPDMIATHFNAAGTPDSYGGKVTLVFEPILAVLLWGVLAFISHFPQAWNFPVTVTEENKEKLYRIALRMLNILKVLVVLLCIYAGLASIISMSVWILWLLLGTVFVVIILSIIQMICQK